MYPSALPLPIRLAIFLTAVAVLLWLCLAPTDELPAITFWDKAEHALAFLVLTGLGFILFPTRTRALALGVLALGVGIEIAQALMGLGRQGDWHDVVGDSVGILTALAIKFGVSQMRQN
jgi:VanZ family protein